MKKPNGCTMSVNVTNQNAKVIFLCSAERRPRSLLCRHFAKTEVCFGESIGCPVKGFLVGFSCRHAILRGCGGAAAILDFIESSGGPTGVADSFAALVKEEIERRVENAKMHLGCKEIIEREAKK